MLSVEVTVRFASDVQLSDMDGLPDKASMPATVVSAAGASEAEQPSMVVVVIEPLMVGAVVSSMLMVCVMVEALPQASVIV